MSTGRRLPEREPQAVYDRVTAGMVGADPVWGGPMGTVHRRLAEDAMRQVGPLFCPPEPLVAGEGSGLPLVAPTHPVQEDTTMSMQIKTGEGILTLSNATDVRTTGVLCVRGHKGVTLGFIAPTAAGWLTSQDADTLADYVARYGTDPGTHGLTMEGAAEALARESHQD